MTQISPDNLIATKHMW